MNQELGIKNKHLYIKTIIHDSLFMIRKSKGFTLVEMVLYMSLLSLLTILMVDIFASSLDIQLESQAASSVEQDGRFLLSRLSYDIQNAQSAILPTPRGAIGNSLQIKVNDINYTYSVNNGNLELTNNNGTDVLNSIDTNVSNVSFQRLGTGVEKESVQVQFSVKSKIMRTNVIETKTFQTTIGLR